MPIKFYPSASEKKEKDSDESGSDEEAREGGQDELKVEVMV